MKLKTLPDQAADNALYLGTAAHTGIQESTTAMVENYYSNYYIIDDKHVNELIKLEYLIPKIRALLPDGEAEVKIECDEYIGYIDWLVEVEPNVYDIYDFKYSNNVDNYLKSAQLHLYKYYFEKCNPTKRIRNLYFVFIPKTQIRQKKTEDLYQFRKRLIETLEGMEISHKKCIKLVTYDESSVQLFIKDKLDCLKSITFERNKTKLCDWCAYKNYCHSDGAVDYDIIYPEVNHE